MNFKLIAFSLFFWLAGCGVKNNPVNPEGVAMPSLLENYPDVKVDKPLNETKKR